MSKAVISLLLAIGLGTWIYNKFMKTTGSLTQRSLLAAGISALVIFLVSFLTLSLLGF